jgi:cobyrinic acid a,c-diamide synthase
LIMEQLKKLGGEIREIKEGPDKFDPDYLNKIVD